MPDDPYYESVAAQWVIARVGQTLSCEIVIDDDLDVDFEPDVPAEVLRVRPGLGLRRLLYGLRLIEVEVLHPGTFPEVRPRPPRQGELGRPIPAQLVRSGSAVAATQVHDQGRCPQCRAKLCHA